jgi:two-component system, NtrC family, nitrogen regulation sensor histidine kinase NtrY
MAFKNFRLQVILRVILLALCITVCAWCFLNGFQLRGIYLAGGVVILVAEFIWYVDRFNRDVKTFMISLQQRDFTTHFESKGRGKTFDELYEVLNHISAVFRIMSAEKEVQYRYLEMLVQHVRVGVLSIDAEGKIHLANQAVKDLLRKQVLMSLKSFEPLDETFVETIREIRTGETRLLKLRVENDLLQLSIHASEFKLEDRYYKLISMQNIRSELDMREMEAWQKLIRVLSHEIMNSVSPIISLSGTLHSLVTRKNELVDPEQRETLNRGLEAIKIRSEGLYNFTQSYRKLTGIPKLTLQQTNINELLARVRTLMQPRMDELSVQFQVSAMDVSVNVDPELIEQVLINLVLNALEAVADSKNATIQIRASLQDKGNVSIHVIDNGEGMDERTAEKIFVPFFTTKKNGSGIGLAITKQILQLHKADIQFNTEKGKGTEFIIQL